MRADPTRTPPVEFLPSTSRFPVSSVRQDPPQRSSACPPTHPPRPIYPRHDPLHVLSQPPPPPRRSYPDVVPAPSVAPGILADGVLTAKLPSVRHFLDAATTAPPQCPPLPTDKRVLALAALSVFYRPLHPAHWAFWNREQKRTTALLVQSVLDATPTPIMSPIAWIDVPESLLILKSMQGAYAPLLTTLPWYATYAPVEPENRMNLRKRKPPSIQPSAANGPIADETPDEEERVTPPPRKRTTTRKSAAASRSADARAKSSGRGRSANQQNKQDDRSGSPHAAEAALLLTPDVHPPITKAAKRERIASPNTALSAPAVGSVQPAPLDVDDPPGLRKSLRQRERKAKGTSSASPASVASTLTPSVRIRGLSQAPTQSRESSAVTQESAGAGECGSSTAVSLCEDEESKSKAAKTVEEAANGDDMEGPPAKKPRTTRPGVKGGSRARTATKNKTNEVPDETKTDGTVQARPKARSRAKTRRR